MKHGYFTQLQRTFYAKKGSIMTRKTPFGTMFLYRLLYYIVLQHFAVVIKLSFIKLL